MLTAEQIQTYWQSVAQDRKLQSWHSRFVSVDVRGEVQQQPVPPSTVDDAADTLDPFEDFVQYDLALQVQDLVEPPPESAPEQAPPKIETYSVLEGILKYAAEHVLLVGKPGSGKTTALERLLIEGSSVEGNVIEGRLPILLRLRDLNPKRPDPVLERLQLLLCDRNLPFSLEHLQALLQQGQFLLLFDGINELPAPDLRRTVQDFRQRYRPTTPMIFTTRPLNVGIDLGIAKKLEMKPLTPAQMQEFVQKHLGREQGDAFFKQLKDRLRQLGETPLLLWMLCGLFRKENQIPANLGLAFRMFASIYEDKKQLAENRFWQSRFLQALAFQMMPKAGDPFSLRLQISRQDAEDLLANVLGISRLDASHQLTLLLSQHLLQLHSRDDLEFKHQLFQEYYAAEYLLTQLPHLSDRQLQKHYLNLLDWSEAVALVAGLVQTEATALRLTRLGLEVDWYWGARLAGEVSPRFQAVTVGLVMEQSVAQSLPMGLWVEILGKTRSDAAIPELLDALEHEDWIASKRAAEALGELQSEAAILGLINALEHEFQARRHAAEVLGELQSEAAIPGLLNALENQDSEVRARAAKALGKLQSEAAIPGLLNAFQDKHWKMPAIAAEVLGELQSEAAIPGLLNALEHENSEARKSAAEVLGKLQSEAAIPGLLNALEDEVSHVRTSAVEALGRLQSEAAIPGLLNALEDEVSYVRSSAATVLGMLQSEAVIPGLLNTLEHEDWHVRWSAAIALERMQSEAAIPGLFYALADKYWKVRALAAEALGRLQSEAAIPGLFYALADKHQEVRAYAAKALGSLQSEAAISGLLNALKDEVSSVRARAAEALGSLQSEAAIAGLLNALKDEVSSVRASAAKALGSLRSEAAIPGLLNALKDEVSSVRARAAEALGQLQSEVAIPRLIYALEDEDSEVRASAAKVLGQLQSEVAIPGLLSTLKDEDSEVRRRATEALGQLQSEVAIPGLLSALEHENWEVRWRAIMVLEELQSEASIPGLIHALEDEFWVVRQRAAEVLGKLQSEAAIPGLLNALEDEFWDVRASAAAALGKLQSEVVILPIWQQHQQIPLTFLKEAIQAIQNSCKIYNAEISQLALPEDQPPVSTTPTVQHITVEQTFNAAVTGVAGNVQGDLVVRSPLPNAAKTSETRKQTPSSPPEANDDPDAND